MINTELIFFKIKLNFPIGPNGEQPYTETDYIWNVAEFLDQNNDEIWKDLIDVNHRPGKLAEYQRNIDTNSQYAKGCGSAQALQNIAKADDIAHIVCPGPSLKNYLDLLEGLGSGHCIIAVNRAVRALKKIDFIPWSERYANPEKVWGDIPKDTSIITALQNSVGTFNYVDKGNPTFLYNFGAENGIANMCRRVWLGQDKRDMLNLPTILVCSELALMMAYWMGFREIRIYGMDMCWYEQDEYYFDGGSPIDPQIAWQSKLRCGKEGIPKEEFFAWQMTPYGIKNPNTGEICYTNPYMHANAQRLEFHIKCFRKAGVRTDIMGKTGLIHVSG